MGSARRLPRGAAAGPGRAGRGDALRRRLRPVRGHRQARPARARHPLAGAAGHGGQHVPATRLLVWGSILGPGFLTRNPYAGFFLLPILVAAAGPAWSAAALAAAIGLAHGTGRALALLRDARPGAASADPMRLVLTSMYWRRLDGITLLVIAAAAAAACASRFS